MLRLVCCVCYDTFKTVDVCAVLRCAYLCSLCLEYEMNLHRQNLICIFYSVCCALINWEVLRSGLVFLCVMLCAYTKLSVFSGYISHFGKEKKILLTIELLSCRSVGEGLKYLQAKFTLMMQRFWYTDAYLSQLEVSWTDRWETVSSPDVALCSHSIDPNHIHLTSFPVIIFNIQSS